MLRRQRPAMFLGLTVGRGLWGVGYQGARHKMRRLPLDLGIAGFLLAFSVFAFAGGARSIYSGLFFVVLGVVFLVNARRTDKKAPG